MLKLEEPLFHSGKRGLCVWEGMSRYVRLCLLWLCLILAMPTVALADSAADVALRRRAVDKALAWLADQQQPDGGWGPASSSSASDTAVAVWALAAAGEDAASFQTAGGATPLDALASHTAQETSTATGTARLLLAVAAAGGDPRDFAGLDLAAMLESFRSPNGRYGSGPMDGITAQAWALLALKAADQPIPDAAVSWLRAQQNSDGGWPELPGQLSNAEDTSWALQALAATGVAASDPAMMKGLAFLRTQQVGDAGFRRLQAAPSSETASTGLALLGVTAGGGSLLDAAWQRSGQSPLEALLQLQRPDGGFVPRPGESEASVNATAYGVLGLIGRPLPFRGRRLAVRRGLDWLRTQQRADGSFGGGTVTADAVRAIALAGENPDGPAWTVGGTSALAALARQVSTLPALTNDAGVVGKLLRAVAAAGADPHDFGGVDLVARLGELYDPATGWYHAGSAFKHALALEGLAAVGEPVPFTATQALLAEQRADGGWGWPIGGDRSDNDTTGRVMCALARSGVSLTHPAFVSATQYLEAKQLPDAGWGGFMEGSPSNSNSIALVMEGLLSVELDPRRPPFARLTAQGMLATPPDALLRFQEPSGAFVYTEAQPESRLLAVLDVLPALLASYPPVPPEGEAITPGTLQVSGAGPGRLRVFVPYAGDEDGDGTATLRFRSSGVAGWSEVTLTKHAVLYAGELAGLTPGARIEIEVVLSDPDGVTGAAQQTETVIAPVGLWLPLLTSS